MHRSVAAARWRATALIASIVGATASAYLLVEYVTGQPGVCLTGSGCDLVRASAFAYPLGVPLPLIGLLFYLVASWLVLRTLDARPVASAPPGTALISLALAGAAGSMVLTFLEAVVIRAFCSWCLVQAGASLVLLAAAVAMARTGPDGDEEARSSRARQQAARELQGERSSIRRIGRIGGSVAAAALALLLAVGASGGTPSGSPDGSNLAPAGSPRLGTGPVTVVEFADFQCPGCAALAPVLAGMASANEMTLVSRYFPLDAIHPNADASARAAAAADGQGHFWQMSDALYARQGSWKDLAAGDADAFFAALAGELGLDVAAWQAAYGSSEIEGVVAADRTAATSMALSGTPTLFIGGVQYTGSLSADGIRAAIAAANAS